MLSNKCSDTLPHKFTIYLHLYLNDWLLPARLRAVCLAHIQIALEKAQQVGFLVNRTKSVLVRGGLQCSGWTNQTIGGNSHKGSGPLQNTAQTIPPDST